MPIVSQETPKKLEEKAIQEMVVSTRSSTKKEKNKTRKKRVLKQDNTQDIEKMPKMNVKKAELIMAQFKEQGIEVLEKMKETDLQDFIEILNAQYYNTKKAMATDTEYDIIKELMERKYPKNTILEEIGAKIEKNKVKCYSPMMCGNRIYTYAKLLIFHRFSEKTLICAYYSSFLVKSFAYIYTHVFLSFLNKIHGFGVQQPFI